MKDQSITLPHDPFSEKAIIGAMIIHSHFISQVFNEITPDDFYIDSHKRIARAILNLNEAKKPVDIVTISDNLKSRRALKLSGGVEYISSLLDGVPPTINIESYIENVKDKSSLRKLSNAARQAIACTTDPHPETPVIIRQLQDQLSEIENNATEKGFVPICTAIKSTMEKICDIQTHGAGAGINTGFKELDAMTGGFLDSDLIIIAARPSMGKTSLALNMAVNMTLNDSRKVGFFSIESSQFQITCRMLSTAARINMNTLISGRRHLSQSEWNDLNATAWDIENVDMSIDDSPTLSVDEMRRRVKRLKQDKGVDIVFVDYLQLMKVPYGKADSRARQVGIISSTLKVIAKENNIPVVALAQLNRDCENRKGSDYQLSDLRDSGEIEQDADVIIFLHRDEQNDKDAERRGEADLIIKKQRNGPTGSIVLKFEDRYTKFSDLDLM